MKRIAIPAVVLFIFVALIVRCFKDKKKLLTLWGIAWVAFFFCIFTQSGTESFQGS